MYLKDLKERNIEGLVLGCTHYPILSEALKKYFNNSVEIFKSGEALANKYIDSANHINLDINQSVKIEYYVTDSPDRFIKYGNKFLFQNINDVNLIKL